MFWVIIPMSIAFSGCLGKLFDPIDEEEAEKLHKDMCLGAAQRRSESGQFSCSVGNPTPAETLRLLENGYCRLVCTTHCVLLPGSEHNSSEGTVCSSEETSGTFCTITTTTDLNGNLISEENTDIQCD